MPPDRNVESERGPPRLVSVDIEALPWLIVFFVAMLWTIVREMGVSPHVWVDTAIEDKFVRSCLVANDCTLVGPGATIGIFHSAGYLSWRSLLAWIGLGPDGTHFLLMTMTAAGIVMTSLCGWRAQGRIAGALATVLAMTLVGIPTQLDVVSDVVPLPFLGCVFLFTGLAVIERQTLLATAVLGMVAGVVANTYASGLSFGVSAVWIALMIPRRRWLHAFIAAMAFVVSTLALAPGTWLVDAQIFFSRPVSNGLAAVQGHLYEMPVVYLAVLTVVAWVVAWNGRPQLLRLLNIPAATIVPFLLVLLAASLTGRLNPSDKYCAHLIGAVAFGAGVVAAGILRGLPRLERYAPHGAVAAILFFPLMSVNPREEELRYRDLAVTQRIFTTERGWSWPMVSRNLKSIEDVVTPELLADAMPGWPLTGREKDDERAFLLRVPRENEPKQLPSNIVVANSGGDYDTLLAFGCSWIDWRSFRVCVGEDGSSDEKCSAASLPVPQADRPKGPLIVPGMPPVNAVNPKHQKMTLHMTLKPNAQCPEEWIYMPHVRHRCPGKVVVGGEPVGSDGRMVRFTQAGEVAIEWELGGPECWNQYRGYPPFFVEGDRDTVNALAAILRPEDLGRIP